MYIRICCFFYAAFLLLTPITFPNKRIPQTNFEAKMKNEKRNLFEEAIADAKAVKDMAIANAKAALEESFTPHLTQMLSAKLQEMESEEETLDEVETEEVNETEITTETETVDEEMDLDELLAELDSEEVEESIDLNEAEDETEEEDEEKSETEDADEANEDEEEAINLEDMSEDDLKSFVEDVIKDMVAAGDIEAGHEGMENEEGAEEVEAEDEVNIDEILAEIEAIDEAKKKKAVVKKDDEKEKLKKELKEAKSTVDSLSSDLSEVNLLNAKLLYTNKIFRSKNLSESQKVKVLTSFDKAKTVKETKLVYETILESLKDIKATPIKESLNLGSASKAVGNSTKGGTTPIFESNDMVTRFKKLAGIN